VALRWEYTYLVTYVLAHECPRRLLTVDLVRLLHLETKLSEVEIIFIQLLSYRKHIREAFCRLSCFSLPDRYLWGYEEQWMSEMIGTCGVMKSSG